MYKDIILNRFIQPLKQQHRELCGIGNALCRDRAVERGTGAVLPDPVKVARTVPDVGTGGARCQSY